MEPVCICTMENVPLKVVSNWPQKLHFVLHAAAALSALVKVKFVKKKFVKKIHQKNSSNFCANLARLLRKLDRFALNTEQ